MSKTNNTALPTWGNLAATILVAVTIIGVYTPQQAQAQVEGDRWYVGGGGGVAKFDIDCPAACDLNTSTYKLFGGHRFNEYMALEFSVAKTGNFNTSRFSAFPDGSGGFVPFRIDIEGNAHMIGVAPVFHVPVGKGSVLGKIGLHNWKAKGTGGSSSSTDDGTDLFFGLGGEYSLTENVGIRVEWERYRFEADGESDDIDAFSASIVYQF